MVAVAPEIIELSLAGIGVMYTHPEPCIRISLRRSGFVVTAITERAF